MLTVLAGLGLGLSLIVAIGAQNVFVLRQGIRREHVLAVVAVCALSDAALIAAGVAGLGYVLTAAPWLVVVARWAGAAFLLAYGVLAARRAWRGGEELAVDTADEPAAVASTTSASGTLTRTRLAPVVLTTLALTWLNPHVYLDTARSAGFSRAGPSPPASCGSRRWASAPATSAAGCAHRARGASSTPLSRSS